MIREHLDTKLAMSWKKYRKVVRSLVFPLSDSYANVVNVFEYFHKNEKPVSDDAKVWLRFFDEYKLFKHDCCIYFS